MPRVASSDLARHLAAHPGVSWALLDGAPSRNVHEASALEVTALEVTALEVTALEVTAGPEPFTFHSTDLLVDVDVGLDLDEAHLLAKREGLVLPLPKAQGVRAPLRPRILDVALSAPFWLDAFVHSLDAVTADGGRVESVRSPRAAIGPDLVGGALLGRLWLVPVRLRLRALVRESTQVARGHAPTTRAAAEALLEWMEEGRASLATAQATADGAEVRLASGPGRRPPTRHDASLEAHSASSAPIDPLPDLAWGSGRALGAPTAQELVDALTVGTVVASPLMGRIGVVVASPPSSVVLGPLEGAASSLAGALVDRRPRFGFDGGAIG